MLHLQQVQKLSFSKCLGPFHLKNAAATHTQENNSAASSAGSALFIIFWASLYCFCFSLPITKLILNFFKKKLRLLAISVRDKGLNREN